MGPMAGAGRVPRLRGGGPAGSGLADHAAVNVVTGGELADGHAAGGVVADDAE